MIVTTPPPVGTARYVVALRLPAPRRGPLVDGLSALTELVRGRACGQARRDAVLVRHA